MRFENINKDGARSFCCGKKWPKIYLGEFRFLKPFLPAEMI